MSLTISQPVRRVLAAGLALAVILVGYAVVLRGSSTYRVTADFAKTPGLYEGNDVVVLGVTVGTVVKIQSRGTRSRVTLELSRDVALPASATAVLLPRSVVTDRVVELTPTYRSGARLADGDLIPRERTRTPVEFQDVVEAVNNLSAELGKLEKQSGAIDDFMQVAADNARGNGKRLRETLSGLQAVMAGFSADSGDTVTLVQKLADLTEVMATNDATIRSFSTTVTEATEMLGGEGKNINAALTALVDALRDVAGFVTEHRQELRSGIDGLADVATVIGGRASELAETLDILPLAFQNIERTIDPTTNRVRIRGDVEETAVNTQILSGFCALYLQLPVCDTLNLGLDPDLGITELLLGTTP